MWSSHDPEKLIGLAMRRCYTTKVWEELEKDVSIEGYCAYLTQSAFRRLEFDVYEHVRALFKVDGEPKEMLSLTEAHPQLAFSSIGDGSYLVSANLRTLTEMGRKLGCDGRDCHALSGFIRDISPTVAASLESDSGERSFNGEKPASAGASDAGFRTIIVQQLDQAKVLELVGRDVSPRQLMKHSFATVEVEGISRACSHQLVRHRLFSYSQESQRFSDAVNEGGVVPPSFDGKELAKAIFDDHMTASKDAYSRLRGLGIKKEDARFLLPAALKTKILMTGSLYQIMHASFYRSTFSDVGNKAQWEIRKLFTTLYSELRKGDSSLPSRIMET